jgi:hypothetical protein
MQQSIARLSPALLPILVFHFNVTIATFAGIPYPRSSVIRARRQ